MQLLIAKAISNILSALAVAVEATFVLSYLGTKNLFLSLEWTLVSLVFILLLLAVVYYLSEKENFQTWTFPRKSKDHCFFIRFYSSISLSANTLFLACSKSALCWQHCGFLRLSFF